MKRQIQYNQIQKDLCIYWYNKRYNIGNIELIYPEFFNKLAHLLLDLFWMIFMKGITTTVSMAAISNRYNIFVPRKIGRLFKKKIVWIGIGDSVGPNRRILADHWLIIRCYCCYFPSWSIPFAGILKVTKMAFSVPLQWSWSTIQLIDAPYIIAVADF